MLDLAGGTLTRGTFDGDGHDATWTPDGQYITYTSSEKTGDPGIYRARPGSVDPAEPLLLSARLSYTGIWRSDGDAIVTVANGLVDGSGTDIAVIPNGGTGPLEPVLARPL